MKIISREKAINAAKALVVRHYGDTGRQWLVGSPPDSYTDPDYRCELHVLEGSPPKGYVIALGMDVGAIIAMSFDARIIGRWVTYIGGRYVKDRK